MLTLRRRSTVVKARSALDRARTVIAAAASKVEVEGRLLRFWPLFLEEQQNELYPQEIDTCATSIGIIALHSLAGRTRSHNDDVLLTDTVETILHLRNRDGSWPSIYSVGSKISPRMEGVINDTIFALDALLHTAFPTACPQVKTKLDRTARVELVVESLRWLARNRAGEGWGYISPEFFQNRGGLQPATLPTANAIALFAKALKVLRPQGLEKESLEEIAGVLGEALRWLRTSSPNGGHGKVRGGAATLIHTTVALRAYLLNLDDDAVADCALESLRWLMRSRQLRNFDMIRLEEFFDEYDQLVDISEHTRPLRRPIRHETFLDGIILEALIQTEKEGLASRLGPVEKIRFYRAIRRALDAVLDRQEEVGSLAGAFRSRRTPPAETHPIYATYYSSAGIAAVLENKGILKKAWPSLGRLLVYGAAIVGAVSVVPVFIRYAADLSWGKAAAGLGAELALIAVGALYKRVKRP